ncbi:MAG: transposase [Cyanobacteria bacterium P01_C01_bin.121]
MVATHAQDLVYRLLDLMPNAHLRASLRCLLALFLASERPRPEQSQTKSAAALSRFLNRYGWPTGKAIKTTRKSLKRLIASYLKSHRGRLPIVYAVVDLTCLEKTGKYKELKGWVRTYNHKRGVHVAWLYLAIGPFRFPESFRVYRGKGTPTPTQLALKLLGQIPQPWRERFKIRVLADAGFITTELIPGTRQQGFEVIMSLCCDRVMADGEAVKTVPHRGQRVTLKDLDPSVTLSWFWRKHEDTGEREQHFVVATEALSGAYIVRLSKRRWAIEDCFKVLKHQFGWDAFGAGTLLGMYRWWILALISYLISHWQALVSEASAINWRQAAHEARKQLFPGEVLACFLHELEDIRPVLAELGIAVSVSRAPVSA